MNTDKASKASTASKASNAYLHPSTLTLEERELIGDFWIEMSNLIQYKIDIKKKIMTPIKIEKEKIKEKIEEVLPKLKKEWKNTDTLYPELNKYLDNIEKPSKEEQRIIDIIKEIIHTTERPFVSAYGGHKQRHTTRRSKSKRSSVKKGKRSSVKKGKRSSVKKGKRSSVKKGKRSSVKKGKRSSVKK